MLAFLAQLRAGVRLLLFCSLSFMLPVMKLTCLLSKRESSLQFDVAPARQYRDSMPASSDQPFMS
ncbi:hypothetical protein BCV70DRAFT_47938 [Testicularia cyperi]|uniref:Uncharacterized protein n=1 Tax=Testicularia cyperi TaxID=1882483 RepID=A0A317XHG6_9BASI|nr:hypothetical protein BCV70DRAFT_47938 [Testicularia cyperi]